MNEKKENINLPKNIKQIGTICDSTKIYIEDYAYTFMHQYSRENKHKEKLGILVGETYKIDGTNVLFISGAIKGKHAEVVDGILTITEKTSKYVNEQIEKYFNGLKVVGWFYVQPGFEDILNENVINYHDNNFNEEHQVLFLNDPIENICNFYHKNKENGMINQLKGYIIYYEKNDNMNEYMLSNKISSGKQSENFEVLSDEKVVNNNKFNRVKEKQRKYRKSRELSSNTVYLTLGFVFFLMFSVVVKSEGKIKTLEQKLNNIDNSYKYILAQIKQDNAAQVFASNDDTITEQTTIVTTEKYIETTTEATTEPQTNTKVVAKEETQDTYIIEDGDTLTKISKKIYGNTSMINEIILINGLENPHKLSIGKEIKLP